VTESTGKLPPVLQGAAIVPEYRTYLIDQNNSISAPAKTVECTGDFDAIDKAKHLVDGHDLELWEGDRLVMRFFHDPRKK
jgi:hypothetical protein